MLLNMAMYKSFVSECKSTNNNWIMQMERGEIGYKCIRIGSDYTLSGIKSVHY